MIDDESRGYILELVATKLLSLEQNVQLIGVSATLNVRSTCPGILILQLLISIERRHPRKVARQRQILHFQIFPGTY